MLTNDEIRRLVDQARCRAIMTAHYRAEYWRVRCMEAEGQEPDFDDGEELPPTLPTWDEVAGRIVSIHAEAARIAKEAAEVEAQKQGEP